MSTASDRAVVRFAPGDATLAAATRFVALVDAADDEHLNDCVASLVTAGASFDEVVLELSRLGFDRLPSLVVVTAEGDLTRIVVRGDASAAIRGVSSQQTETVSGAGTVSWVEQVFELGGAEVTMSVSAAGGPVAHQRWVSGSALVGAATAVVDATFFEAGSLSVPTIDSTVEPDVTPERSDSVQRADVPDLDGGGSGWEVEQLEPLLVDEPRPAPAGDVASSAPSPAVPLSDATLHTIDDLLVAATTADAATADAATADSERGVAGPVPGSPTSHDAPRDAEAPVPPVLSPAGTAVGPQQPADPVLGPAGDPDAQTLTGSGRFDDLFGHTMVRSIAGAEVRPEVDAGSSPEEPTPDDGASADVPDRTITLEELRRMRESGDESPAPPPVESPGAPTVLSALCPDGHPNPPYSPTCRVCGGLVPTQDPRPVVRPRLGVLRFSHGPVVDLYGPALVGRSPKPFLEPVGGTPAGDEQHVLVDVPSPDHDISRTHLELRVEGWQVVVVDLGSTNGTVVQLPGRPRERLRPNEPCIVTLGAEVSLADEIRFNFEAR